MQSYLQSEMFLIRFRWHDEKLTPGGAISFRSIPGFFPKSRIAISFQVAPLPYVLKEINQSFLILLMGSNLCYCRKKHIFFCINKSLYKLRNVFLIGSFPLCSKGSCLLLNWMCFISVQTWHRLQTWVRSATN